MFVLHTLTESSRVPFVRSKMSSLPSPDALFVSRKRRSYQVSFSREEADSQRSFQLRNDLYGLRTSWLFQPFDDDELSISISSSEHHSVRSGSSGYRSGYSSESSKAGESQHRDPASVTTS